MSRTTAWLLTSQQSLLARRFSTVLPRPVLRAVTAPMTPAAMMLVALMLGGTSVRAGQIYWTATGSDTIERSNADGSQRELLVSGLGQIVGLEVDRLGNTMYWLNRTSATLQRSTLTSQNVTDVATVADDSLDVRLDRTNSKLYWSTGFKNSIARVGTNGPQGPQVIPASPATTLNFPDGLAIDSAGGFLYWTEVFGKRIARSDLNGGNVQTLVTTQSEFGISDVVLDVPAGLMYWTEPLGQLIRRANLDGSNVQTVLTLTERPFGLSLDHHGNIYWADFNGGRIRRGSIAGGSVTTVVSGLSAPRDVIYVVPEPASLMLFGAAVTWLLCVRGSVVRVAARRGGG